ncbi:Response regulator receiver domain-containing protein [Alkalispirochaeta americana]|uniref:Response regulator receiver domain-containing protein n=1 Tax=Alkalispirochaeta americana TaxID=159291 RepID=A0A1N6NZ29_9SPIO|nr:response regulator [Alkalispirochaeta americana]SIP97354.1 Response regulator receiver domain-containing protein [Alkalispirochaeta americana]
MKKILVIDESQLFRDYLKRKLEDYGFTVFTAVSGLDGATKLRRELPDLLISDFHLSRKPITELLREKQANRNTQEIPVIIASSKVDRASLVSVAPYKIKKFLTKPLRVDALLKAVGETLDVSVTIDETPCIIEAHVNDDIIFIEVAQGINREKVDLLRYKLTELIDLYDLTNPKVLIMMSGLELTTADSIKLSALLTTIVGATGVMKRYCKVLTKDSLVRDFVSHRPDFSGIEVTGNLDAIMDGLLGKKVGGPILEQKNDARDDLVQRSAPKKDREEAINMRFEEERAPARDFSNLGDNIRVSIVDDDLIIQELIKAAFSDTRVTIDTYDNGKRFVESSLGRESDLVFLDLMMPEMDGFQVLRALKEEQTRLPIVVLSALSKRETVLEALKMGVTSYMIKPLKPQDIRTKASEILQLNF